MEIKTQVTNTIKLTTEDLAILIAAKFGFTEGKSWVEEIRETDSILEDTDWFVGIKFTNEK